MCLIKEQFPIMCSSKEQSPAKYSEVLYVEHPKKNGLQLNVHIISRKSTGSNCKAM